MDPFWETNRPVRPQTSTANGNALPPGQQQWTPTEEREIGSGSEQDPSVLEVPAINWAKYVGVKSVQYIKMWLAPRVDAIERAKQLGPGKCRQGNGKTICNRPAFVNDGNH